MGKLFLPAVAAAVLTLTGCVSDFNESDYVKTQPAVMDSVVIEGELSKDLRIIQTSQLKTESGVEDVTVRARLKRDGLKNFVFDSGKPVEVSYKFTWYDAQGNVVSVGGEYRWQTVTLYPGGEISCSSRAPEKGICKVKLEFRSGAAPAEAAPAEFSTDGKGKGSKKLMERELPADIRDGKATTTKEIKAKTDAVEKNNKVLKEINRKVEQKSKKTIECLCGCANGESCYCPADSVCRKNKNEKK